MYIFASDVSQTQQNKNVQRAVIEKSFLCGGLCGCRFKCCPDRIDQSSDGCCFLLSSSPPQCPWECAETLIPYLPSSIRSTMTVHKDNIVASSNAIHTRASSLSTSNQSTRTDSSRFCEPKQSERHPRCALSVRSGLFGNGVCAAVESSLKRSPCLGRLAERTCFYRYVLGMANRVICLLCRNAVPMLCLKYSHVQLDTFAAMVNFQPSSRKMLF